MVLITSDPAPCRLMLSLLHGKQNLWCGTEGHCTKCVSSKRSWHNVHFKVAAVVAGVAGDTPSAPVDIPSGSEPAPASVEVTVVDETCLEPDDLRPLEEPATQLHRKITTNPTNFFITKHLPVELGECWEPLDADLGAALPGGLPPVDLGLPGGKLSATDIKAAIGLCPEPGAVPDCWPDTVPVAEPVAPLPSGGEPVLLLVNGDVEELEPFALATVIRFTYLRKNNNNVILEQLFTVRGNILVKINPLIICQVIQGFWLYE